MPASRHCFLSSGHPPCSSSYIAASDDRKDTSVMTRPRSLFSALAVMLLIARGAAMPAYAEIAPLPSAEAGSAIIPDLQSIGTDSNPVRLLTLDQCIELALQNNPGTPDRTGKDHRARERLSHSLFRSVPEGHGERLLYQGEPGPCRRSIRLCSIARNPSDSSS